MPIAHLSVYILEQDIDALPFTLGNVPKAGIIIARTVCVGKRCSVPRCPLRQHKKRFLCIGNGEFLYKNSFYYLYYL